MWALFSQTSHLPIETLNLSKGAWALSHTFFYRVHLSRNKLPTSLREILRPSEFKWKLLEHLWICVIKGEYEAYIKLENTDDDHPNFPADYDAPIYE